MQYLIRQPVIARQVISVELSTNLTQGPSRSGWVELYSTSKSFSNGAPALTPVFWEMTTGRGTRTVRSFIYPDDGGWSIHRNVGTRPHGTTCPNTAVCLSECPHAFHVCLQPCSSRLEPVPEVLTFQSPRYIKANLITASPTPEPLKLIYRYYRKLNADGQ